MPRNGPAPRGLPDPPWLDVDPPPPNAMNNGDARKDRPDEPLAPFIPACLKAVDWLQRDLPEPDFMLGNLLSTTTRMELIGPTGIGKTNFAMALAVAIAAGDVFLHWGAGEGPRRVLYIDGEMSNRQMKKRIEDAARRAGAIPGTFYVLSRDDVPDMPPLDTAEGQRYVDKIIESIGGIDLVTLDNIQALLPDDDDYGAQCWRRVLPWVHDLTRSKICQIWIHHTGRDESHGYGTKTREWQLDTVALMERVERPEADIAFKLKFEKARERTPDNRNDFEPAVITLKGDDWISERGNLSTKRKKASIDLALDVLKDELARGNGKIPPANERIPPDTPCLDVRIWRSAYMLCSIATSETAADRAFYRDSKKLQGRQLIGKHGEWVWPIRCH